MLQTKPNANPRYAFIHHSGGLLTNPYAKTSGYSWQHVENAHKARGFPKSDMGFHVGYNVIYFPDGSKKQFRNIGEETAATRGFNNGNFQACLMGNFNSYNDKVAIERPTEKQVKALAEDLEWLFDEYLIKLANFKPHRAVSNTNCYGTSLSDKWVRELLYPHIGQRLSLISLSLQKIMFLLELLKTRNLGGDEYDCPGYL